MTDTWTPATWQSRPAGQQPDWPDLAELDTALHELGRRPPLVFAGEARRLTERLGEVANGRAFVLQAGDCAESFELSTADAIRDKLKIILQMAAVMQYSAGLPIVKIGRIAGQFGKPRSSGTESRDGTDLPSFRGHIVNDVDFDEASRRPDPGRILRAYDTSAATLNLLRAFTRGGYADLRQVHTWNQEFVASSPEGQRYETMADGIDAAMRFMEACGFDLDSASMSQVTCTPATKHCFSGTNRHSLAATPSPTIGTTARRTCCGLANGLASSTVLMSNSSAAFTTRLAARSGQPQHQPRSSSCAMHSTQTVFRVVLPQ